MSVSGHDPQGESAELPDALDTQQTVYHLGASASEPERLVRQAEIYRQDTRELLEAVGLRPGARALDLGCGPLGILDELAARVGADGQVVGLERDDALRHHAAMALARRGIGNVELVGGHARRTNLPFDHFDFTHARLLLVNMRKPRRVVAEMARVTRPGGIVVLHDVDWASWLCEPMADSWLRLKQAARTVWERDGLDVHVGRRLPDFLRQAGVEEVTVKTRIHPVGLDCPRRFFLLSLVRRIGRTIVERGLLSAAELSRFQKELHEHLSDPSTLVLSPTYFQAWGRKAKLSS